MMVRESKKTMILDAAIQVIEEDGITAVTFDSVAAAAGITRAGIIYHFPSRDDLIAAIHQRLADRWERQLENHLELGAGGGCRTSEYVGGQALHRRCLSGRLSTGDL